ncbi:MAG: hypothetical protein KF693_00605 [Nitrospira sp.]|nr:hypothetical protein [Nitrospira sp.]
MDQGMDRIAQDVKDIAETRTAIADKLEKLEHRFTSTVAGAKIMAGDFATRTQSMIEDTVDSVKDATDPSRLVSNHPWVLVSGAIMVGFAVGRLLRQDGNGVIPYYPPGSHAAPVMPSSGADTTSRAGVYPFYPQSEEEDPSRSLSSTRSSVSSSLGPIFAESLGQLATELVDIGRFALRTWLNEVVHGKGARSLAHGRPSSTEVKANRTANNQNEHQQDSQLVDA